ncbi:hypothetical protein BAE44_0016404, partial [Dichanthelium oligosanthes]
LCERDECALCAQETWFRILRRVGLQDLTPQTTSSFPEWWTTARKMVAKTRRQSSDSMAWLVAWSFWRERNNRVHNHAALQILEEVRLWALAGFCGLQVLLRIRQLS